MEKNKIVVLLTILLLSANGVLFAQHARFVNSGTITYEKRVNMFAVLTRRYAKSKSSFMEQALEQYKKSQPQFQTFQSTLSFNKSAALYTPIEQNKPSGGFFGNDPTIDLKKIIYTDFNTKKSISQKTLYEETYLIEDTTRQIHWKITSETREIAGYNCRRANALVMDSIYVVAFYTDQIPVSGGPESFTGLPGMILGLALPHENVTWFATKVEDASVPQANLNPPKKGTKFDNAGLLKSLKENLEDWGEYAQDILKAMML